MIYEVELEGPDGKTYVAELEGPEIKDLNKAKEEKPAIDFLGSAKKGLDAITKPTPSQMALGGLDPFQRFAQTAATDIYGQSRGQLQGMVPQSVNRLLGTGIAGAVPGGVMLPSQTREEIGRQGVGLGIDVLAGTAANKAVNGVSNLINDARGLVGRLNPEQLLNKNSAYSASKEIPKSFRAEGVFSKRASDIESRAASRAGSVVDQLKNEKDAVKAQIDHSASIATEAKAVEKANLENEYAKKLLDTHDEIIKTEKAIPYAAQRDANAIKKEIPDWMKKKSAQWNDEIDSALGGADADIFTNKDTVVNELSQLLRSRGVDIVDGVPRSMNGQLGLAEQKIADVINRINNSPSAPSVRSLIKDTAYFGRGNKYGKLMAPDQALLDDARSVVASQAEDILPQIKDIKGWYSDYAQIRNRAFQSLDPFGGRFSRRGTEFIQKLATGKAGPEDYQFLDALESSVGKSAGRESFELSREANALKQFEDSLKNMKEADIAKVNASLDAEISRLQDVLKKESTALENKAGNLVGDIKSTAKERSSVYLEKANNARIRLAKLNRYKTLAKWVVGGASAVGGIKVLAG